MMPWYAVYIVATGALYSVGTVVANPLLEGMAVRALGRELPSGEWNPNTLSFEEVAHG